MATRRPVVVVFGIAFLYPLAGVTWQFLHYLVGLRRLKMLAVERRAKDRYFPAAAAPAPAPAKAPVAPERVRSAVR